MKKIFAHSLMFVLLSATAAHADHGWALYGAFWDGGDAGDSPGVGTAITYEIMPRIALDLRYTNFEDFGYEVEGIKVDLEVAPIELGLQFFTAEDEPWQWMGGFGFGLYQMDAHRDSPGPGFFNVDDEWGVYLSGGVEYTFARDIVEFDSSRFTVFAEAVYRIVEVGKINALEGGTTPNIADDDLNGLGFNAGVKLRW